MFLTYTLYKSKRCKVLTKSSQGKFTTIIIDKKLTIIDIVNPNSNVMLAQNASSLIGCCITDLNNLVSDTNKEQAQIVIDKVTEASNTKSDLFFEYLTIGNGTSTHTMCYTEYQNNGSLLCYAVEISSKKRVAGCGKCADYSLAMAMNSLSVGVYTKRMDDPDKLLFANNVIQKLYECENITKSPDWDDDQEKETDRQVIETSKPISFSKVTYYANGTPHKWFDVSKTIQSIGCKGNLIVTTVTDISELKKREIELEETKIHLGIAIGAGDVSVWRYNIKEKQFRSLYGELNLPTALSSTDMKKMIHPDDVKICYDACRKIVKLETKSEEIVFRMRDKQTQQYKYIKSELTVATSNSGQIENIIGTYKNITAARLKEMELRDMRNSLDLAITAGDVVAWEYDLTTQKFKVLYGGDSEHYPQPEQLNIYEVLKLDVHSDDIAKYLNFISDVVKRVGQESIIVRGIDLEDGNPSYSEITVSAIKNEHGVVTKSQRQKVVFDEMQKNLALAMEAGGVSVWLYDVAKETFFTIQGDTIAGEGLTMADNLSMMHPDDAIVCKQNMGDMAAGKIERINSLYRYRDDEIEGGYRYFEARQIAVKENGQILNLTGTQKEVTKEQFYKRDLEQSNQKVKQALAELQQLNKYNKLILDNTGSGLIYVTTDYVVRWENVSSMTNLDEQYSKGYRPGSVCYKTAKGTDMPCTKCIMRETMETHQKAHVEIKMSNGEIMDLTTIPVFNEDNTIDGVIMRMDDVTELKKSYKELQVAKDKAERSDLFKSTFLANMSHEIRTPLNAIVGFSELIADVDSEEDKREYNNIIAMNNELLLKLINDILDLSKIEAGFINIKNEDFDIAELYNELNTTFSQRMHSGVELRCDNPYNSCIVNLDRNRLTQVITNFLTNAIKFTKEGYIQIGYKWIDEGLKLYVTDTGIGISENSKQSVFDRFEKLNDFAQGTGLGLSICKSIIEAEGGTIGVDSELNHGSTFWAIIPCKAVKSSKVGEKTTIAGPKSSNVDENAVRKNILVAEDTESNYVLINSILKKHYNLTRVVNGEEAVEAVKNNSYDVVLMDEKMPVMNGYTATRKIREFNQAITIIALTANVFDSDRKTALEAGCNEFLTKPIDKARLIEAIEKSYS